MRLLTRNEVAKYLKVDYRTVKNWEKELGLPVTYIKPRTPRYSQMLVDEWLKERSERE